MSGTTLSALTNMTDGFAGGDFLVIVDISEVSDAAKVKRVALDNLFGGVPLAEGMFTSATELTISSGVITATQSAHKIQPESGTTDDLATVNGLTADKYYLFFASDYGTDTITWKHGTGNISILGGNDVSMSDGFVVGYSPDGSNLLLLGGSSGGGGVSDGDKGDITVSGSGTVWTIDAGVVTLAKMANMATDSFIGRDTAGIGVPEVLSAATARGILNVADGADVTGSNPPQAHAASHENGGGDEISIAGLSGVAADNQNPTNHASNHTDGTDDIQSATASQKGLATATQISKLDGIESGADVTDTTNVTAAGALMDSEVDADIKTLALPANTTISTFGASIIDDLDEAAFKATTNLEDADITALAEAVKLDDFATPDDNTDLDATTSRHGLLPKLSGTSTEFLNGAGNFATPSGGGASTDGWNSDTNTWTYSSVDDPTGVLTINADVTDKISVGMRLKFTNGGNTIYGIVTKDPVYSSPNTTITFLHEIDPTDSQALHLMANSAITGTYYSTNKAPFGFPSSPEKWTVVVADTTLRSQASPVSETKYNLGGVNISVPIGAWFLKYSVFLLAIKTSSRIALATTLSTSTSTVSDSEFTLQLDYYCDDEMGGSVQYEKLVTVASKTTYYVLTWVVTSSVSNLYNANNLQTLVMKARCAYL
jgi:hypothetical protein